MILILMAGLTLLNDYVMILGFMPIITNTLMVLLVIMRAIIISPLIYLMEEMNVLLGEQVDHIWVQWEDTVVGPVR